MVNAILLSQTVRLRFASVEIRSTGRDRPGCADLPETDWLGPGAELTHMDRRASLTEARSSDLGASRKQAYEAHLRVSPAHFGRFFRARLELFAKTKQTTTSRCFFHPLKRKNR